MSVIDHAAFLSRLKADGWTFSTFYDIGASIGGWTKHTQRVYPDSRFELFEPLAGRCSELDAASQWSSLTNCGFHRVGLSDENGEAQMKVLDKRGVGSTLVLQESDSRRSDLTWTTVPIWRLDDYVANQGLPAADFLKLDVQAGELKVLRGAERILSQSKMILCETWARRVYGPGTPLFHELAAWLYERGFVMFDMLFAHDNRDATGELRWFDAVFVNRKYSRHPQAML